MRCARCGHRFGLENFIGVGPGGARINVAGTTTHCPLCGGVARQEVDGEFDISADGRWRLLARALRSPDATANDYVLLREMLQRAERQGADAEAVAIEIKNSVPTLAALPSS